MRWSGNELQSTPGWPEDGLPVDGRITALALWPRPDNTWLLIVATDERCLIAADESGRIVGRIPTPHVVTALTPVPASGRLWMSLENKRLRLLRPVWPPLLARPFPSIPETFQCLPLARRGEIQQSWLQSDDSSLVGAAVQGLLDDLAAGNPEVEKYLEHLSRPDSDQQPREHVVQALAALESAVLTEGGADTPLLRACLRLARSLYPRFDLRLRWRIDLLTARVAACLDEDAPGRTADYHCSASRAIRALVTLPGSPQALLATRAGEVFQVDLRAKLLYPIQCSLNEHPAASGWRVVGVAICPRGWAGCSAYRRSASFARGICTSKNPPALTARWTTLGRSRDSRITGQAPRG